MSDEFKIGGKVLQSRLFVGSGKYSNNRLIPEIIKSSKSEVITVALRRVDFMDEKENMLNFIPKECVLMPNTSGARNAEEAVRIARLARITSYNVCYTKLLRMNVTNLLYHKERI